MYNIGHLRWQCRRGMLELDLMLLPFVDHHICALDNNEILAFERLLEYPDQVLLDILMGRMVPANSEIANVVTQIRGALVSST